MASPLLCIALLGCSDTTDDIGGSKRNNGGNDPSSTAPTDGTSAADPAGESEARINACMQKTTSYKGFGGVELTAERLKGELGQDRGRVKPYSALAGEFQRVAGSAPASLTASASTFAEAPARWFTEPQASAVTMYQTYRVAFEAALGYVGTDAKFATAPTDASAGTECAAFARKAWSRTAGAAEIDACKKVAITGAAGETDAKRKWAYAFAAILGAAGFTSY